MEEAPFARAPRYCFLNILGFKKLVEKVESDPNAEKILERLISALRFMSDECTDSVFPLDV